MWFRSNKPMLANFNSERCDVTCDDSDTQVQKGAKHQTHARRKAYASAGLQDPTQTEGAMQAIGVPREQSFVLQPYAVIRHGNTYCFVSDE